MLVSSASGVPSGISLASAEALFSDSLPLSLLNSSLAAAKVWRRAYANDTQAFTQLTSTFNLTNDQLWSLMNWMNNSFNPTLVQPNLTATYQISSLREIAFLQWSQVTFTGTQSVKDLYKDEVDFPIAPELPFFPLSTPIPLNTEIGRASCRERV